VTTPEILEDAAKKNAKEPARAVTHVDVSSLYMMIAALANILGQQARRITELEGRPKAGRPPKAVD
jgi:hypothetical protein